MRRLFAPQMGRRGFTLTEVLVASFIGALVAVGTLASFLAARRMTRDNNATTTSEASAFSAQLLEELRNNIAADDTLFATEADGTWRVWDVVDAGSTSGLSVVSQSVTREYRITQENCGAAGNCYAVSVRLCWDDSTQCVN